MTSRWNLIHGVGTVEIYPPFFFVDYLSHDALV